MQLVDGIVVGEETTGDERGTLGDELGENESCERVCKSDDHNASALGRSREAGDELVGNDNRQALLGSKRDDLKSIGAELQRLVNGDVQRDERFCTHPRLFCRRRCLLGQYGCHSERDAERW